jgi:transcriptional regulator with XRE-family HTH domain
MSLADVIKHARENMKIKRIPSRKELADMVGVTPEYLGQLESGVATSASIKFLKRYAQETGVPLKAFTDQIEV